MSNMNNFDQALSGEIINTIPEESYAVAEFLGTRQGRSLARRTQGDVGAVHCRMALTATALEQVGRLTIAEGILNQVAPWGQARYKAIVDSFTAKAVEQITKF